MMADKIWITRKELADRLGVSEKTAAEWASKGTGPRYARFGKHARYRVSDVEAWEEAHLVRSTAPEDRAPRQD